VISMTIFKSNDMEQVQRMNLSLFLKDADIQVLQNLGVVTLQTEKEGILFSVRITKGI